MKFQNSAFLHTSAYEGPPWNWLCSVVDSIVYEISSLKSVSMLKLFISNCFNCFRIIGYHIFSACSVVPCNMDMEITI